jgi:hypothetical protein
LTTDGLRVMSTLMRRAAVSLIAVFTGVMIVLAFGGCACACDDNGADSHPDGASLCIVSCACHGAGLTLANPSFVAPRLDRAVYRLGDEQVKLPLSVADIFNPPRV